MHRLDMPLQPSKNQTLVKILLYQVQEIILSHPENHSGLAFPQQPFLQHLIQPISHVTTREMVLNREASADYFEPNSNTPESGQLPCPQSNSDAYHKRKKSLRTK